MGGQPPGLLIVLAEQRVDIGGFPAIEFRGEAGDERFEFVRNGLEMFAQRQVVGEAFELAGEQPQRVVAQRRQRLARHIRGHARMAVAVAADPSAEADHRRQCFQIRRRKSRRLPGLAQVRVAA